MTFTNAQKELLAVAIQNLNQQQSSLGNPFFILDILLSPKDEQVSFLKAVISQISAAKRTEIGQLETMLQEIE